MFESILATLPMALGELFSPICLLSCLLGSIIGFTVGAIPGIGATVGIALMIPLMMRVNPAAALSMFVSIYMGGEFGGCVSAILINVPGTGSAAATVMDGFPMSKKGKAITALSISAFASFIGGIISPIILILVLPFLSRFILIFGTPEFFLLAIIGVTCITAATGKSVLKGLVVGFFGLMLCTVGISPVNAQQRYTFGSIYLFDGFGFLPALIGLFGIAEMLKLLRSQDSGISTMQELKGSRWEGIILTLKGWKTLLYSCMLGLFIGLVPGVGATTASFVSWAQAKKISKTPEEFGKGCPEGIIATESSNNSVIGGALIPTIMFGIPGSATAAVVLGGLMMLGIQPGQALFRGEGLVTTEVILLSLILSATFLLFVGIFVAPYFGKVTLVRKELLIPTVIVLASLGIYVSNNNLFDVFLIMLFGIIGYLFVSADFPLFPLVLALILGNMIEENFLRTMALSDGHIFAYFFERPACIVLLLITALLLFASPIRKLVLRIRAR